jgi:hypothetical protein
LVRTGFRGDRAKEVQRYGSLTPNNFSSRSNQTKFTDIHLKRKAIVSSSFGEGGGGVYRKIDLNDYKQLI